MDAPGFLPASSPPAGRRPWLTRQRRTSLLLIAPMLLSTLLLFVLPIALMLFRAVENPDASAAFPRTAAVMPLWQSGDVLPPAEVQAAFLADLADDGSDSRRRVGAAARRLNSEASGLRSLFLNTWTEVQRLEPVGGEDAGAVLTGIDPRWSEPGPWAALRSAMPAYTDFYLLSALDLKRTTDGTLTRAEPDQRVFLDVLLRTMRIAAVVTLISLMIGYPLAALIIRSGPLFATVLMASILLPFWTSLLAKTASWIVILQADGPLNQILLRLGLIRAPLDLIFNATGLYIVMVHMMLPFMVLPLCSVMRGIPPVYMRAAASLGSGPVRAFLRIWLPMTLPGIGAGALLTFIISAGYYIAPSLVAGPKEQLLGAFIAHYAYVSINWGLAAALGLLLLVVVLALYLLAGRLIGFRRIAGLK